MQVVVFFILALGLAFLVMWLAESLLCLVFGSLRFKNLCWVAILSFSYVAAIVTTDATLGSVFPGRLEAVRMFLPIPGGHHRSFVERILGSHERVLERDLAATGNTLRSLWKTIREHTDREPGYTGPIRVGADLLPRHLVGPLLRTPEASQTVLLKYPYLDSFFMPLFGISTADFSRLFPFVTSDLLKEYGFPESPGTFLDACSIGLFYELNAYARYQEGQSRRRAITQLLVPALFLFFVWALRRRYRARQDMEPVESPGLSLAGFVQIFGSFIPLLFLFEMAQPTCYRPGQGRPLFKQKPEMKVIAEEILATYSQSGIVDPETIGLLKEALQEPKTLIIREHDTPTAPDH